MTPNEPQIGDMFRRAKDNDYIEYVIILSGTEYAYRNYPHVPQWFNSKRFPAFNGHMMDGDWTKVE
jgi:hypothetical protein